MKQNFILFSVAMIVASRAGRKTQTRRVIKPQPDAVCNNGIPVKYKTMEKVVGKTIVKVDGPDPSKPHLHYCDKIQCPYGAPGDLLRVKEATWMWCERKPNGTTPTGGPKWHYVPHETATVYYVADFPRRPVSKIDSPNTGNQWGWRYKAARFMPSWAVRDTLEVTEIRAERLNTISHSDAVAEGVALDDAVYDFSKLWDSINAETYPWASNPWVWVITFRRQTNGT